MARIKELYSLEIDVLEVERVKTHLTKSEYQKTLERLQRNSVNNEIDLPEDALIMGQCKTMETDKIIVTRWHFCQNLTDFYLVHKVAKDGYTLIK